MWAVFALAVGWFNALYYICNQNSKLKSSLFMFYRGFIAAVSVTPALLFFMPDFQWQFYIIVVLQGFAISYFDLKYFQAFQKFGAETVCAIKPLIILITFVFWLIIEPQIITHYLSMPWRSLCIILSILVIVYSTSKYRAHPVGLECFIQVFPILIISTINDIFNKIMMHYTNGNLTAGALWRVFITGCIIGLVNMYILHKQKIELKEVFKIKNLRKGLVVLFLVLSMISVNFSFYHVKNPAYTSAIVYASVIWIMLTNKFLQLIGVKIKNYEHISKKWIFTILIASVILIFATS